MYGLFYKQGLACHWMQAVNGKQVQISLTGFMERNTGKFMKELWALLISAQQNVSGVPQQFLDAKEEETKKKKVGLVLFCHCRSRSSITCIYCFILIL